jgi:uncharacterized RDD family membrane protein YckC
VLAAILLLSAAPGCLVPATGVFADAWDGRLSLVLNLVRIVEDEQRFAIYHSDRNDLGRWTLAGTYGGRARAAAIHGGLLWVFFEGSPRRRPFARTYPLPGWSPEAGAGATSEALARPGRVVELPFAWTPSAACRDARGSLWVVGVSEGRIVAARLVTGDAADTADAGDAGSSMRWDSSFPPGPELEEAAGGAPKLTSGSRTRSDGAGMDGERRGAAARVRISASDRGLFAFWSVTSAGSAAKSVRGALLTLDGPSPRRPAGTEPLRGVPSGFGHAGGPEWRDLPEYSLPHRDFCAAPSADGTPGLVLRRYAASMSARRKIRPERVELQADGGGWSSREDVSEARQSFLFGYVPRAAWVQWGGGQLLVRTNTQRVELLERKRGRWLAVIPAGFLALYLTEIEVLMLAAGALLLVIVGGTAFAVRMRRLGKPGAAGGPARPEGLPRLAPISRRAVAALFDVLVVGGVAFSLVGLPDAPADPLVPDPRPLFLHLGALAVYGAVTEALFGATPGKLALGLRVELAGGGRPGVARAIVRNLLRPVDIIPPYLGAVGLSLMTVTGLRQRLGDLAAGTVVVAATPAPVEDEGKER